MPEQQDVQRQFTGRHMLIIMLAFFGIIIAVNMVMALMASKTWTGLIVKNAYVESQKFNEYLSKADEQDALGWVSHLTTEDGMLKYSVTTKTGVPVQGLDVTAYARRPTHEGEDRAIRLTQNSIAGQYVRSEKLATGVWNISVIAQYQTKTFRKDFRVYIKKE